MIASVSAISYLYVSLMMHEMVPKRNDHKLANVSQDDGGGGDGGGSDGEQTPGKKRESLIHTCSLFVSEHLSIIY